MLSPRSEVAGRDAGTVTAEVAVTFPVVVLALSVVLLAGSLGQAAVACADGARSAARALSRGEDVTTAVGQAQAVLGRPAAVEVSAAGPGAGLVRVEVTVSPRRQVPGGWAEVPLHLPVSCRAHAWAEPGR